MALVESLTGGVATIATDKFYVLCKIPPYPHTSYRPNHVFGQAHGITEPFAIVQRDGPESFGCVALGNGVKFARASAGLHVLFTLACHNALLLPPYRAYLNAVTAANRTTPPMHPALPLEHWSNGVTPER